MSRHARHVLGRFAGTWAVVSMVTAAGVIGLLGVPGLLGVEPSPWVAVGPTAALAALWSVRRTVALGEDVALAVAGARPVVVAAGCTVLITAGLVVAGTIGGRLEVPRLDPDHLPRAAGAWDGSLLVSGATGSAVLWRPGDRLPIRVASHRELDGFLPMPRSSAGLRLRLFAVTPPWSPTPHPADPTVSRWIWAGLSVLVPWWILAVGLRADSRRFVAVP